MKDPFEILALYHGRRDALASTHTVFRAVRAAILNEIDVPLPELDSNERAMVANLILIGVTQTANRVASTMPMPYFPPLRRGIKASEENARNRRARTLDFYDKNLMTQVLRKRALHYLAYAATPVVVKPNPRYTADNQHECSPVSWEIRDPLDSFLAEMPVGQTVPDNAIFTYTRSYRWATSRYGTNALDGLALGDVGDDTMITILEFIDADEVSLFAVSNTTNEEPTPQPHYGIPGMDSGPKKPPGKAIVPISQAVNKAKRPLCVVAGQITLERPQSMYEGLVGLMQAQGRMMALEYIGMMRSIWPEEWLQTRQGETANIVTQADPIAGIVGKLEGAELKLNAPTPAQFGVNLIDRLERAQRMQGSIPPEYGGESGSNIRTDKRGLTILSNTVDFSILAAHQAFEASMREENRIAAEVEKAYFPAPKTFASTVGRVTYTPADLWEQHAPGWVRYPSAGSDADALIVAIGQRVGIGVLSKMTAMELDPFVDDAEFETERVRAQQLEELLFQNLGALAQADPNYMSVIAKLDEMLRSDAAPNVLAAWLTLDAEYKKAQAAAQTQPTPGEQPPGPEAGQPGLAQPGAAINPPGAGLSALGQLTQVLRHTSRSPAPPVPVGG